MQEALMLEKYINTELLQLHETNNEDPQVRDDRWDLILI